MIVDRQDILHRREPNVCYHRWLEPVRDVYPGPNQPPVPTVPSAYRCLECRTVWVNYTEWQKEEGDA